MATQQAGLTIGQLARAADVNVETIRYYQRIGLLAEPERPASGYRRYAPDLVDRLRFIKRAQSLGFNLREVRELLALGEGQCDDVRHQAEAKLAQITRQINDLKQMQVVLEGLIRRCAQGDPAHCAIVQTLSNDT